MVEYGESVIEKVMSAINKKKEIDRRKRKIEETDYNKMCKRTWADQKAWYLREGVVNKDRILLARYRCVVLAYSRPGSVTNGKCLVLGLHERLHDPWRLSD